MEISTREKLLQTISRYIIITLSISIMTIGVYFFKFPNNFVFGGVGGVAADGVEPDIFAQLSGDLVGDVGVACKGIEIGRASCRERVLRRV